MNSVLGSMLATYQSLLSGSRPRRGSVKGVLLMAVRAGRVELKIKGEDATVSKIIRRKCDHNKGQR